MKRILRYGLYFFAGLWMFALGVMVGRGNAPVSFDTRAFQARLESIAREHRRWEKTEQTVDLKFYEVLKKPVGLRGKVKKPGEILPKKERVPTADTPLTDDIDGVPVKFSRKMASLDVALLAAYQDAPEPDAKKAKTTVVPAPKKIKARKTGPKPKPAAEKKAVTSATAAGKYTIQVAAFKDQKDAASEVARLQKKGIAVYKVKAESNGTTWYRLRTGAFPDYEAASARLETLNAAKIKGMIIKKE